MVNGSRTRRLKPETVAREVAMAEAESGRTPGRWPTIMLDATCTAYCDRLTAAIGSATRPTLPPSRARSPHHPAPPLRFSSRVAIRRGRSGALSPMAAAGVVDGLVALRSLSPDSSSLSRSRAGVCDSRVFVCCACAAPPFLKRTDSRCQQMVK
jgi:hypothetical protein